MDQEVSSGGVASGITVNSLPHMPKEFCVGSIILTELVALVRLNLRYAFVALEIKDL